MRKNLAQLRTTHSLAETSAEENGAVSVTTIVIGALALSVVGVVVAAIAFAAAPGPKDDTPTSPHNLTGGGALLSDYIFYNGPWEVEGGNWTGQVSAGQNGRIDTAKLPAVATTLSPQDWLTAEYSNVAIFIDGVDVTPTVDLGSSLVTASVDLTENSTDPTQRTDIIVTAYNWTQDEVRGFAAKGRVQFTAFGADWAFNVKVPEAPYTSDGPLYGWSGVDRALPSGEHFTPVDGWWINHLKVDPRDELSPGTGQFVITADMGVAIIPAVTAAEATRLDTTYDDRMNRTTRYEKEFALTAASLKLTNGTTVSGDVSAARLIVTLLETENCEDFDGTVCHSYSPITTHDTRNYVGELSFTIAPGKTAAETEDLVYGGQLTFSLTNGFTRTAQVVKASGGL